MGIVGMSLSVVRCKLPANAMNISNKNNGNNNNNSNSSSQQI